jgi:surface antigen
MRFRIAGALLLLLGLSGCAAGPEYFADAPQAVADNSLPRAAGTSRVENVPGQKPLQCVPYARENSQVKIYGDAWTWWQQAAGKYERGNSPATGAVMVLHNYAGPNHGHVAVVRRIVSPREIRIDHANWLNDGSIYVNNPVVDVSAANDWSQVRVFNIQTGAWGGKTYPVQGFIGAGSSRAPLAQPDREENSPMEEPPIDELIATLSAAKPVRTAAAKPAIVGAPKLQPVWSPDRNPPADSPFALTAEDRAIPDISTGNY